MLQRTLPPGSIALVPPDKNHDTAVRRPWLPEIKHDGFRIIARKEWRAGETLQPSWQWPHPPLPLLATADEVIE